MGTFVTPHRVVATPEEILATPHLAATPTETKPTTSPTAEPKPGSIEADLAEAQKAADALKGPKTPEFEIRFVKNVNPHEQITFKDGKKFRFPASLYRCKDAEQAEKIKEVADQFGIVLQ